MKNLRRIKIMITALFLLSLGLYAQISIITPLAIPENFANITSNFSSINVGKYSVPAVADINNDGLLDLIVQAIFTAK
jgi:hypothetical protein